MPYRKTTIRKMPPHTRKLARLLNELDSVHTRLRNLIDHGRVLELYARASMKATAATKEDTT